MLLGHLICVIDLFHAGRALRSVSSFEASVQALVSHAAIAIAIAWQLMDQVGDLCRNLIGMRLKWILVVRPPELALREDRRKLGALSRRRGIEGRYAILFVGRVGLPPRRSGDCQRHDDS